MKLFGSIANSKHATTKGKRRKKKNIFVRLIVTVLALLSTIAIVAAIATLVWLTTDGKAPIVTEKPIDPGVEDPEPVARTGEKYTFLIVGTDDGNGNTDTMMVATLDTDDYTLDIVSIPRDTMVNVSWSVKKINSLYGVGGIERTLEGVSEILGYEVDFYVMVDLEAFVVLVDEIGGVYYDVPVNMNYEDPAQDLYIHINKGPQMLGGKDAVKVVRCRSCYSNADLGRIETQQGFLKAMAEQILEKKSEISITKLATVFLKYVDTDLKLDEVKWLAKECLKLDHENIRFHTLPGDASYVSGGSYVTIRVSEWLEMINEYLNPFDEPIKETGLNILTKNSAGAVYSTSGKYAGNPSWGNGGSSSKKSTESKDDTKPNDTQKPSEDPNVDLPDDPNGTGEDPNNQDQPPDTGDIGGNTGGEDGGETGDDPNGQGDEPLIGDPEEDIPEDEGEVVSG